MEDQKYHVLNEIKSAFEKDFFRKMMGDKYRCSAKCCDNTQASTEEVVRCRQTCEMPLQRAHEHMQQEVDIFMSLAQRCFINCNDSVRDKWSGKESQTDQLQMREEITVCENKCANEFLNKLPEFGKRLKAALENM